MVLFPYLSERELKNLSKSRYNGVNLSLTYKHFMSPLCEYLTRKLPETLAPNLITTLGFVVFFVSGVVAVFYNPRLDTVPPTWVLLFIATGHLFYMIMDNMDGKQARRTGTGSPMGQLFDHGFDSLVAGMVVQTSANFVVNPLRLTSLLLVSSLLAFWGTTYEEFMTETLLLGPVNGADEGNLLLVLMEFLMALFPQAANSPAVNGVSYGTIAFSIVAVVALVPFVTSLWRSFSGINFDKYGGYSLVLKALSMIVPPVGIQLFLTFVQDGFLRRHPRAYLLVFTLYNSNVTIRIMLAHLCKNFDTFWRKKSMLVLAVPVPFFYLIGYLSVPEISADAEDAFMFVYLGFVLLMHTHFVVSVVKQISEYMNLPVFTVRRSKKD